MGIWDRLGSVIKSYINADSSKVFGERPKGCYDPDLDAAYEDLDDFLKGNDSKGKAKGWEEADKKQNAGKIPEELKKDFAELGLEPDATLEECKEAYKKLLKIHHPDRHTKHDGNMKKATEKSAQINAAYERLIRWFRLQNPP
jgi:DnaJ-domain-containing protein 1